MLRGIRTQIARLKIPTAALDGVDLVPPPSGSGRQTLSIKASDGLVATRTVAGTLSCFWNESRREARRLFPDCLNAQLLRARSRGSLEWCGRVTPFSLKSITCRIANCVLWEYHLVKRPKRRPILRRGVCAVQRRPLRTNRVLEVSRQLPGGFQTPSCVPEDQI